ncbi:uncharacterized protein BXZ73DRAFT_42783 [Epithele typhae]|uniref:uncharacterized protein n=1 Tax=Epithele typhae TaxID=378194 RepID=UPI002007BE61|nr:uncharacterized protein BXZ73DRAFT_42783 [Epithele typhae]KAH9940371.1 hypothetical protein BXZ73DRAFT_42783 [Epithele typhae]
MSKKGAKVQDKEQSYDYRDIVLAKVRGFPPWPGMIVDPDTVPDLVQKERPNAKTKKGNWYCVQFFPAGDFAWTVPKDISRLQQHEIQAYLDEPAKRSAELMKGYRIALDPKAWEEEREATKARAQEQEANAEVDQLDSDGEDEGDDDDGEKKKKPKKRKRDSDAAASKSKSKAKKTPAESSARSRTTSTKGKKGPKSKALVESEDDAEADNDRGSSAKRASPPPNKKAKRDKEEEVDSALAKDPEALKVREWRHRLQKAFLNSKVVPKDEDMPALDELFTQVQTYPKMSMEYLLFSKIGKVMRHINALPDDKVPRDAEFRFRERSKVLVDKWHEILKSNGASESGKPATNGARKSDAEENVFPTNGANTRADVYTKEETTLNGAGDESMLADVTMSEAA